MSKMIVYNINKKWILDKQDSFIDAMHRDERDSYLVSLYNYMFRKCSLKQILLIYNRVVDKSFIYGYI